MCFHWTECSQNVSEDSKFFHLPHILGVSDWERHHVFYSVQRHLIKNLRPTANIKTPGTFLIPLLQVPRLFVQNLCSPCTFYFLSFTLRLVSTRRRPPGRRKPLRPAPGRCMCSPERRSTPGARTLKQRRTDLRTSAQQTSPSWWSETTLQNKNSEIKKVGLVFGLYDHWYLCANVGRLFFWWHDRTAICTIRPWRKPELILRTKVPEGEIERERERER